MKNILFFLMVFVITSIPCLAKNGLNINEPLKQGGYYVGKVMLGDKVTFHGKTVKQSSDGSFVIGLGWKYKAKANIRVDHKAGGHTIYRLDVVPHDYETE